ncbi:hypothetical protein TELCIR_17476 [Teladorsagia circumcincta]|uniref:EGF-like domain-containing protein n=1 Tax=Teladorsagia circumcincta TaxID=45464 RepID=A0A2G9TSQ6_TELCI|nr:hypothetical protein TELCIR_17476 [Teladorsagia circumcincta]
MSTKREIPSPKSMKRVKAQAEDIVEDIEEEIGGANRSKRQAVTYRPDVKLWDGRVNYYFNSTVGHAVRSVFKKAADVWQRDTCIDFTYDPYENCEGVPSTRCENGGFPHPRDCKKCVCPGGYAGDRCNERPKGKCGRTVKAKQDWNILNDTLGDTTVHRSLEDFTICTYWIEVR